MQVSLYFILWKLVAHIDLSFTALMDHKDTVVIL